MSLFSDVITRMQKRNQSMQSHITEPSQQAVEHLMHPEDKPKTYHLFVYGTLKRNCFNHIRLGMKEYGKFVRKHMITEHVMRTNYGIPFIERTYSRNDIVVGEIFVIDEVYKKALDVVEQGYEFKEIEKGIYCYVPTYDVTFFPEVPLNKDGFYEWTPALELKYEKDKTLREAKQELHQEQTVH